MAAPPPRTIGAIAMVLVALSVGVGPVAAAGQIDEKRTEVAAIASKLEAQARDIVARDKEHRKARDELQTAEAAVARAESDLASATRRQDEARRLLAAHAQAAYVGGGSVNFLGQMARATILDAGARRTYLRVVAGEDRQAIGRLQVAREDLQVRQKSLAQARKLAAQQADAAVADLAALETAMNSQRTLLAATNGELAAMVAAEQRQRDADEAAARLAAAATNTAPAPAARAAGPAPTSAPAMAQAPIAPAAPAAPASSASVDATFACIRQLESGNNYQSPGGGAYQFLDSTWQSLGYSGSAQDHPPAVQDKAARELLARSGWSQWSTAPLCGRV